MKLIIQIPCFNESESLPDTVADLPKRIPGIDSVEILVIDDGSADSTSRIAKEIGVHHVIRLPQNQGLAKAFMAGLTESINLGADIVVNTDADNQYCADDIPSLIQPILENRADIVIGERPINSIEHFSPVKKWLQQIGSAAVRFFSKTNVQDAPSGFRAFSRQAASRLNVFGEYTYTLETIIQAGQKNMAIVSVPIRVNGPTRESRLVKSIPSYVRRSVATMIRVFIIYRPMRFFTFLSVVAFIPGFLLGLRFVIYIFRGGGQGNIQSIILAALLMGSGLMLFVIGVVTDLISVNRKLLEQVDARVRDIEHNLRQTHPDDQSKVDS